MAVEIDLSKYIDTRFFGERPHIRGRRLPIATLAYSHQSENWGIAELAYQFTVSEAEVLAGLLYYEEHKAHIDALEAAYQRELDELHQRYSGE